VKQKGRSAFARRRSPHRHSTIPTFSPLTKQSIQGSPISSPPNSSTVWRCAS